MATRLTKKQKEALTDKITGLIRNGPSLRMTTDSSVNELNINQISGELNRIHYLAIGKDLPTVISFEPKQLGSGDTSPDNIRDIVGYEIDGIGTVYGGDLNIETGVLTVTTQMIEPSTVSRVNTHGTDVKYWLYPSLQTSSVNTTYDTIDRYISNIFKSSPGVIIGNFYVTANGATLISVPWESEQSITTLAAANAWVSANKPQFLIPLATPETYTLTPQQMIQLLDQL